MTASSIESVWLPQAGPQEALFYCPFPEVFFGGSRGGGKTDGVLGKWGNKALRHGAGFNAIMFRKTMPSQDDAWERAKQIYVPVGAVFNEAVRTIKFPQGGRIRLRPLENIDDASKYQGQNVSDVWVEEVGVYAGPEAIDRLHGILRSATGVPTQMILTGNPGGVGQTWIKERYVTPAPLGMKVLTRVLPNGGKHRYVYIPSKIQDNRILLDNDPEYINRLHLVGSKQLVEAWLNGDWDAIEGAFFDCWVPARHVIRPFQIPSHWARIRSMDWGSAAPFSVNWFAVASETITIDGLTIPCGCLVMYREWYGASKPNVGLKMTAEAVGAGIMEREIGEKIHDEVLDPAAFSQDGGPSIAERIYEGSNKSVNFRRADNTRVGTRGRMGGWDLIRARLVGDADGNAMLVTFATCKEFIRTFPVLQHDPARPEDVFTDSEDHGPDSVRYGCASRPWTAPTIIVEPMRTAKEMTMKEAWAKARPKSTPLNGRI